MLRPSRVLVAAAGRQSQHNHRNVWRGFQHGTTTRREQPFSSRTDASSTAAGAWLKKSSSDRRLGMTTLSTRLAFFSTTTTTTAPRRRTIVRPRTALHASFLSEDVADFETLGVQSPMLLQRLQQLGLERPTTVQAQAFADISEGGNNVTVGAETGTGKTLAYLLPLMDDILQRKQQQQQVEEEEEEDAKKKNAGGLGYDFARAVILVPNKELVQQVIRMALPLAGGPDALVYGGSTLIDSHVLASSSQTDNNPQQQNHQIRMAILPGGLKDPLDFPPFRQMQSKAAAGGYRPIDLIVSTPAALGPLGLKPKNIDMFADIRTLVIDEADMLLDGGYIQALEQVLMGFRRADRLDRSLGVTPTQHVFVAATLPDYGLRSVDAYLKKKFPTAKQVTIQGMHQARHSGLVASTQWMGPTDSKKRRMEYLCELLEKKPSGQEDDGGGLLDEKVMVFLNSVQDVELAAEALKRKGFSLVTYHAKMPVAERTQKLDQFRRYKVNEEEEVTTTSSDSDKDAKKLPPPAVPILVCTDLAARGLDVPGVTAVVQLQFAGNVVAHLHRMGRCGRAGQRQGRGFVFFGTKEEALVKVIRQAEQEQHDQQGSAALTLEGPDIEMSSEDPLDDEQDGDGDDDTPTKPPRQAGTVNDAFSRRRGFSRKRKQLKKKGMLQEDS